MHIQDLILLVIGNENGKSLKGRTTLQKKLYFLSVLEGVDLGFHPHYYGPYSNWVSENLDILVNCGFLNEVTETFSSDQNIFGEIRRHTYSLTSDGETILHEIRKEEEYQRWQDALERINKDGIGQYPRDSYPLFAGTNDFNKLSIAAKIHYIVNMEECVTTEQIRKIAQTYGWHIKNSEIEEVSSFLKALSSMNSPQHSITAPPDRKVKNDEKQKQTPDHKHPDSSPQLPITGIT